MSQTDSSLSTYKLVWACLLAALIGIAAFIQIPLWPVPITLQTMFVLLAGLILGPWQGAACVLLYIVIGGLGFPVFSGGKAGWAVLFGPTGGYLAGFVLAAVLCGWGVKKAGQSKLKLLGLTLGASLLILICGSLGLSLVLDYSLGKSLLVGLLPFVPGDVLKSVAATAVFMFLKQNRLLAL